MSLYQPGIPTGTVDLDQDYINLRNNFGQIDTTYTVDHVPLTDGTAQNGYHKALHIVQQAAPAAVSGVGTLYTTKINDGINDTEELFYRSGSIDLNIQLTRNLLPVAAVNGYTFLPGGLILQWFRIVNAVSQTLTAVTYAGLGGIAFPNNGFHVQASINEAASSGANVLNISSVSNTGFSYYNTSSAVRNYYVLAIGN